MAFEKDPKARTLIATDVIAEGVNLQVANIIVNYEVPWSLIKLEQRIGRVWRLGQKKDVEVYTLFMDNIADKTALNSMYQKLFNLKRAELQPRPIIGQEVLFYYAETKDIKELDPSVALTKKRKFVKVTEAKSIRTYLEKDEVGLQELVQRIIAAKREIEKELSSKGVLYKPRSRKEVEETIKIIGFESHKEIFNVLTKLLKASAPIINLNFLEEGESIKVWREQEMPTYINTLDGFYAYLTESSSTNESICITAKGENEALISMMSVSIKDRRDGTLLYADLVGVDLTNGKILRGSSLLHMISQAIANCIGIEVLENKEIPIVVYSEIIMK